MAKKLKEIFFTEKTVNKFAVSIKNFYPDFDKKRFSRLIYTNEWEDLELKQKMRHISTALKEVLPVDFKEACYILKKAAPEIKGFEAMSLPDYIELYGMDDLDSSLDALYEFTKFSSSEFAIRPFIIKYSEKVMDKMTEWSKDPDTNVRRFSSEGCRPRLPWAMALPEFKKNPDPIIPILENLKDDESDFVRRSVANNLNDISKDNPGIMLTICEKWYGNSERTDWIIKHACRTLLKAGDKRAMTLFGYGNPENIHINDLRFDEHAIKIGDYLYFSFNLDVKDKKSVKVRIEYRVDFMKSNGKLSGKVFKITENTFKPGIKKYNRKHQFADMSTRKHYPGKHIVAIIINGEEKNSVSFELTE
ncbi:MAG: DNA alkylation repair protein [Acidobacteriota bacterium]